MQGTIGRRFAAYMSKNIMGMLGISCYIIVDTYFISVVAGTDGVTVLNLCLPMYNVIYAIGAMIGMGAAIRYAIGKSSGSEDADRYFSNAVLWVLGLGTIFTAMGALIPGHILRLMGADDGIIRLGIPYLRTFMLFAPFFMLNFVVSAFVRNDDAPGLAMAGTIAGSMFNLIFDYVFMFPMGLGLFGAALATAFSPLMSILVCSIHFFGKQNRIRFVRQWPSLKRLIRSCQVGVSAFIGEFSSGVITTIFNFLLLGIAGNVAVAAYGVTANLALVATSIFNGIAQGAQPIVCERYGHGDQAGCRRVLRLGVTTALVISAAMYAVLWLFTEPLVAAFNSEGSAEMAVYAFQAVRIYFAGFVFAGVNTVLVGYFSAMEQAVPAMLVSVARGVVLIAVCAFVLAWLLGMTGVWLAFPAAEALTLALGLLLLRGRGCNPSRKML